MCIVIYNSLGMSAFWGMCEKIVKTSQIWRGVLRRALGLDLGSISGGFGDHFGTSWVPQIERKKKKTIQKP